MAKIGIIGGGVIGSSIAVRLIEDGHEVSVFEREPEGLPASSGNAGLISPSELHPVAMAKTLLAVPGWLLDPLGPLAIRWRDVFRLAPFLLSFLAAARPKRVRQVSDALTFLARTTIADHQAMAQRIGVSDHPRKTGALHIFDSEKEIEAAARLWEDVKARLGYEARALSPAEARAKSPDLTGPIAGALYSDEYWMCRSPLQWLRALQQFARQRSALSPRTVREIRREASGIALSFREGGEEKFEKAVVAAGVWSRDFVRALGLRVRLEAERGYNTTYASAPIRLPVPVFFDAHGFITTPIENGVRVGGAVELAAPEAPPNFLRAKAMRQKMRRYFPTLPEEGGREWMGRRPATPDSLPVIGTHPGDARIVFAFGHGHLGLTFSAATARHVAAMLRGERDPGLAPFGIERFQ